VNWAQCQPEPKAGWVDQLGRDCAWYGAEKERCEVLGDSPAINAGYRDEAKKFSYHHIQITMKDCCECQEGILGGPAFNAPGKFCTSNTEFEIVGARETSWSSVHKNYKKADTWRVNIGPVAIFTMEAPNGECEFVGSNCVSSRGYRTKKGYYNTDACTITMLRDATVTMGNDIDVEEGYDKLSFEPQTGPRIAEIVTADRRIEVKAGDKFQWKTDKYDSSYRGWQMCFSAELPSVGSSSGSNSVQVGCEESTCMASDYFLTCPAGKICGSGGCYDCPAGSHECPRDGGFYARACTNDKQCHWSGCVPPTRTGVDQATYLADKSMCCGTATAPASEPESEIILYKDCWWFEQEEGRCRGPEASLKGSQGLTAKDVCCVCKYGRVVNHWGKYVEDDGSLAEGWSESAVAEETSLASENSRLKRTNRALVKALKEISLA